MSRLLWWLRWRRHDAALGAGVALIVLALALQALVTAPIEDRVEELERQRQGPRAGQLERLGDELTRQDTPAKQLASFYAFFARDEHLTARLARLYASARAHGLELTRADYRLVSQPDRKLDRYQIALPLTGSYPRIRSFIAAVLRDQPTAALEQIQFQRKDIADGAVEAQISFSFFLAR